jgi:hypothetical protein
MKPINLRIAEELGVREQQVFAAISLLDGGATVPFVARSAESASAAAPISEATNRDPSARLPPVIDRTLPFAEAKEAYRISKVAADFRQGRDHTRLIVRVQAARPAAPVGQSGSDPRLVLVRHWRCG